MKYSFSTGQYRRSKYLPNRNIHICHTVFKVRLMCCICQMVQHDLHACPVLSSALYDHIFSKVKGIYDLLLDLLIFLIIQGIDPDHLIEDLRIVLTDLRCRESNDGKASFFSLNITVLNFTGLCHILYSKLLLAF